MFQLRSAINKLAPWTDTDTDRHTRNLDPVMDFVEVPHGPRHSTLQAPQYSNIFPPISPHTHWHKPRMRVYKVGFKGIKVGFKGI